MRKLMKGLLWSPAHRCGHYSTASASRPRLACPCDSADLPHPRAPQVCWREGLLTLPQPLWVVSCPHARPRVANEPLDAPLQHRHVVGFGKVHDFTDSLGREVAVGYDAAAELMEGGHALLRTLLRTLLRILLWRAGTRSSTVGYEIARIARCEAFWRVDHAALGFACASGRGPPCASQASRRGGCKPRIGSLFPRRANKKKLPAETKCCVRHVSCEK